MGMGMLKKKTRAKKGRHHQPRLRWVFSFWAKRNKQIIMYRVVFLSPSIIIAFLST